LSEIFDFADGAKNCGDQVDEAWYLAKNPDVREL